jgi:hypothetical protein
MAKKRTVLCCLDSRSAAVVFCLNVFFLIAGAVMCGVVTWGVRYQSQLKDAVPPSGITPLLVCAACHHARGVA